MCDNVHVFSFTGIVDMGTAGQVFVHAMALWGMGMGTITHCLQNNVPSHLRYLGLKWPLAISPERIKNVYSIKSSLGIL